MHVNWKHDSKETTMSDREFSYEERIDQASRTAIANERKQFLEQKGMDIMIDAILEVSTDLYAIVHNQFLNQYGVDVSRDEMEKLEFRASNIAALRDYRKLNPRWSDGKTARNDEDTTEPLEGEPFRFTH